jgi:hypothetical protein
MDETMNQLSGSNGNGTSSTSGSADGKPDRFLTEESRQNSLRNLRPWTKQTAPKSPGRRRRDHPLLREIDKALRSRLSSDPQRRSFYALIAQSLVRECAKGNVPAIGLLLDRLLGRVQNADAPLYPQVVTVNVVRNLRRDFSDRDRDNDPTR